MISKVAFWTLYSIKVKVGQIGTCSCIKLALFIGKEELIEKIWITEWLTLRKASLKRIDQRNNAAFRESLHKIIFESKQR